MSLSGNYSKYPVSSFGLYVEWSATQSITGNYSDITQKIYLSYNTIEVSSRSDATSTINGSSVTYTTPSIRDYSSGWKKKLLYTHTVRVNHTSTGTATNISLSASWRLGGTYSGVSIGTITASTTINLNAIDRTAPTVTITTSEVTASSVKVQATASTTCNSFAYSTDNGSTWTNYSTTSGTTASKTITGLTPNTTYNIKVRARKSSNAVYGTSSTSSVKTLGGSVLSSVSTFTADAATAKITLSATVYNTSYTHTLVIKNGLTTVLTISSLSLASGSNTITLTSSQHSTVLAAMSSVKSFTGTFELKTFSGTTQIGTTSSTTAIVQTNAANSAPIFSGFTYNDSNTTSAGVTGNDQILVQGISTLQITVTAATPKNGATISSYSVIAGSVTASGTSETITVGEISQVGTVPVIVSAIDSRGYTTSATVNITVVAYEGININSYSMRRKNEVEDSTQVSISGDITAITVGGVNKNNLRYLYYRYKKTSDSSYSSYYDITSLTTHNDNGFDFASNEWIALDANYSYSVQFLVTDKLTSDSVTITIPQGTPLLSFRKKQVGVNKSMPTSALDVNGIIKQNGFNVMGVITPSLPTETDLNDIIEPGLYFQRTDPTENYATYNFPSRSFGMLEVFSPHENIVMQKFTLRDPPHDIYIRLRLNKGNFENWRKVAGGTLSAALNTVSYNLENVYDNFVLSRYTLSKQGDIVHLNFCGTLNEDLTGGKDKVIAYLPQGLAPAQSTATAGLQYKGTSYGVCAAWVRNNREIRIRAYNTAYSGTGFEANLVWNISETWN